MGAGGRGAAIAFSAKAPSRDEAAELQRLFDALPVAIKHARRLFHDLSVESTAYIEADAEVARLIARINMLLNR